MNITSKSSCIFLSFQDESANANLKVQGTLQYSGVFFKLWFERSEAFFNGCIGKKTGIYPTMPHNQLIHDYT